MAGRTFISVLAIIRQPQPDLRHVWHRLPRASRSLNVCAISKHCCARRRYFSALLATIPLPVHPLDDKRRRLELVRSAGGVHGWVGWHRRVPPRGRGRVCCGVARGAHVASSMVGGRLKGSPCLQRADERHTLVNALGRTSYSPTQGPPEGFRNPAQSAPEPHALGGVLVGALSHRAL